MENHIGIDFGTTNTALVAIIPDEKGCQELILGENGNFPFSSIVAIPKLGNDQWLFGRTVKEKREELSQSHYIISSIKNFLSNNDIIQTENGENYNSVEITTAFLKYIKLKIREQYNIEIENATFSFPVDFSSVGREALYEAAKKADIIVNNFISESTAAYIANKEQTRAYSKVLVLDWGGGTFDISLLECNKDKLYEIAVTGEKIGGDDIDLLLAKTMHSKLALKTNINKSFEEMQAELRDKMIMQCEAMKIEFSAESEFYLRLNNYGEFQTKTLEVTYEEFVQIIKPIMEKTILTIERALKSGKVSPSGIDAVVLVGGSAELRAFWQVVARMFGEEKIVEAGERQWSVAKGAAMIDISKGAYYLNDDVCVELSNDVLYPILKKDIDRVGTKINPIKFALSQDSLDAHFIFKNSDGTIDYGVKSIKTKGFLDENLLLECSIGLDQTAKIKINNDYMGDNYSEELSINKLKFHYNLSAM